MADDEVEPEADTVVRLNPTDDTAEVADVIDAVWLSDGAGVADAKPDVVRESDALLAEVAVVESVRLSDALAEVADADGEAVSNVDGEREAVEVVDADAPWEKDGVGDLELVVVVEAVRETDAVGATSYHVYSGRKATAYGATVAPQNAYDCCTASAWTPASS